MMKKLTVLRTNDMLHFEMVGRRKLRESQTKDRKECGYCSNGTHWREAKVRNRSLSTTHAFDPLTQFIAQPLSVVGT